MRAFAIAAGLAISAGTCWQSARADGIEWSLAQLSVAGLQLDQIQTKVAFQYHLMKVFWPEFEVSWSYDADGQRGGLNQVYLTPGLVIGRFRLADGILFTTGDRGRAELPSQPVDPSIQQRLGVYLELQLLTSRLDTD